MKKTIIGIFAMLAAMSADAKTLIAYYSYTGNVAAIVEELSKQIEADAVRIEPAEKGLRYEANNYAIGSQQIQAIRDNPNDLSSYPEIDAVNINFEDYDTFIIAAPLWWRNMASPMQSFLFQFGSQMSGKNIGLIVSSASSSINEVVSDAKRLIPNGIFFSENLWIRSSQTSNAAALLADWLNAVNYSDITPIVDIKIDMPERYTVHSLSGARLLTDAASLDGLPKGLYIVNGEKMVIK